MSSNRPSEQQIHEAIDCLRRLADAFGQRRRQLARSVGLTEHQWGVLEEIASEQFMPSMFARRRESTPAAVSKTLRQLLDKGLATANVSEADGRQRKYLLTAKGRRTLASLRTRRKAAIDAVWRRLDARQLAVFTQFGNELTARLSEYAQRANQQ